MRESLDRGHRVSARAAFLRATSYYQATFFLPYRDPRKKELYGQHGQCFEAVGALFDPRLRPSASRHEWEVPMSAVVDYFISRPEADPRWVQERKKMNLSGLAEKITCPLLNVSGTGAGKGMYDNARAFLDQLPNPRNRFVPTTEEEGAELHGQKGNASLLHQIEFDWLDEVLATR